MERNAWNFSATTYLHLKIGKLSKFYQVARACKSLTNEQVGAEVRGWEYKLTQLGGG